MSFIMMLLTKVRSIQIRGGEDDYSHSEKFMQ